VLGTALALEVAFGSVSATAANALMSEIAKMGGVVDISTLPSSVWLLWSLVRASSGNLDVGGADCGCCNLGDVCCFDMNSVFGCCDCNCDFDCGNMCDTLGGVCGDVLGACGNLCASCGGCDEALGTCLELCTSCVDVLLTCLDLCGDCDDMGAASGVFV
jgi:hypothetical protein